MYLSNETLPKTVTSVNRADDAMKAWRQLERQLTCRKDDYLGRRLAASSAVPERGLTKMMTSNNNDKHPQGFPRGGEHENPTRTDFSVSNLASKKRTTLVCSCGKVCKNNKGLKIHQTKTGCQALNDSQSCEGGEHGPLNPDVLPIEPITRSQPYPLQTPNSEKYGEEIQGEEAEGLPSAAETSSGEVKCPCGKILKNKKGLKIHQTKMSCQTDGQMQQRTGEAVNPPVDEELVAEPDETEEEPGPESPHSARNLQATDVQPNGRSPVQQQIKWPTDEEEWQQFDEDLDLILSTASKGNVDQKLQTMCTLITSMGAERFGVRRKKTKDHRMGPNRREIRISQLRKEMKSLKK